MNKIFNKKNLPLFGIMITITIVVAVVIYKKRSDCNLKKNMLRATIASLAAESSIIEAEIEKHLQDNNLETADMLRNDILAINEEINSKQALLNTIC